MQTHRKHYTLFFIACFFITTSLFSQGVKQFLKLGADATAKKDYSSAAQYYNQVILIDSSKIEYQLLFADASRLNYDNSNALHWYEKVNKKDNGKVYKEVPFYIATLLKGSGKYKEAKKYFDKSKKVEKLVLKMGRKKTELLFVLKKQ